jgi:hypothetical protein
MEHPHKPVNEERQNFFVLVCGSCRLEKLGNKTETLFHRRAGHG